MRLIDELDAGEASLNLRCYRVGGCGGVDLSRSENRRSRVSDEDGVHKNAAIRLALGERDIRATRNGEGGYCFGRLVLYENVTRFNDFRVGKVGDIEGAASGDVRQCLDNDNGVFSVVEKNLLFV